MSQIQGNGSTQGKNEQIQVKGRKYFWLIRLSINQEITCVWEWVDVSGWYESEDLNLIPSSSPTVVLDSWSNSFCTSFWFWNQWRRNNIRSLESLQWFTLFHFFPRDFMDFCFLWVIVVSCFSVYSGDPPLESSLRPHRTGDSHPPLLEWILVLRVSVCLLMKGACTALELPSSCHRT